MIFVRVAQASPPRSGTRQQTFGDYSGDAIGPGTTDYNITSHHTACPKPVAVSLCSLNLSIFSRSRHVQGAVLDIVLYIRRTALMLRLFLWCHRYVLINTLFIHSKHSFTAHNFVVSNQYLLSLVDAECHFMCKNFTQPSIIHPIQN